MKPKILATNRYTALALNSPNWFLTPPFGSHGKIALKMAKHGGKQLGCLMITKGKFMNMETEAMNKELAAIAKPSEDDIDFSDIPETSEEDWRGAVRGKYYRPVKQQLLVKIDADVLT
jgi:uncharacterized protein (DUF4415 family)